MQAPLGACGMGSDAKAAFTVKLSQGVIAKVRGYAATAGCRSARSSREPCWHGCFGSEGVADGKPGRPCTVQLEYRFDRLLPAKLEQAYQLLVPYEIPDILSLYSLSGVVRMRR